MQSMLSFDQCSERLVIEWWYFIVDRLSFVDLTSVKFIWKPIHAHNDSQSC